MRTEKIWSYNTFLLALLLFATILHSSWAFSLTMGTYDTINLWQSVSGGILPMGIDLSP
jgi:hypothetical protein